MNAQTGFSTTHESEAPFGFDELFYSRTDKRGVIQAGNDVFQRVAGFSWDKLINAPHKIVRHKDVPKGVFCIMWDSIQKGNPIGAYVKNRCENGDYYWVLAVILPIDGGYLSVRLKPSSDVFQRIKEIYPQLVEREQREGLTAEESASLLREEAESQGFSSYTSFIAYALGQELAKRDERLKRAADRRTRILAEMNHALEQATEQQMKLLRSFEALQSVPNNMRIVASRMEPSGGPVSAISENYKASSQVISQRLASFVGGHDNMCERLSREVARVLFLIGCNRVMSEMVVNIDKSVPVPQIDWFAEKELLHGLETQCTEDARTAMSRAVGYAAELNRASADIRRQMLGLDTIRVLGRVECGRMRDVGGLSTTIDQLDSFHADIKERLEAIMQLSEVIENAMSSYMRSS
ncbi:PAS domain-containing protein [Thioclava sp. GXIMD4216]|uniref:PAS domain-containing protein n=1 Tax=unclassified Thioclava TaxID=2621713 RepID=UPI0030CBA9B8